MSFFSKKMLQNKYLSDEFTANVSSAALKSIQPERHLFVVLFAIGGISELGEFQSFIEFQKKPSRGVARKRCSENMQQIYRRTPMPNCDFNKVAKQRFEITLRHGCSPLIFLHIFRTSFTKNTSGRLLLEFLCW